MMVYCTESYEEIVDDIVPMLEKHWKEVEWGQDIVPLNPNLDYYKNSEAARFYTIRNDNDLVGYNVFTVFDHPHHKGTVFALNDMLYIDPEYRHLGYAQGFVMYSEDKLSEEGVSVVTYSMKKDYPFTDLMTSLGYEHTENIFSKFVG